MVNWTQEDFNTIYSAVKARVARNHAEFGNSYSYGWDYYRYGSRRAIDGSSEEIGFASQYKWITALVDRNVYTPGTKTLIVGCGVGATIYRIKQDFPNASVWGTDTSTYIHSIKDTNAPLGFDSSLVLSVDITAPDVLAQLKTGGITGNGKVGVVICESITETIPPLERPAWYLACESLLSQGGLVAHLVMSNLDGSPGPPTWQDYNWTWQDIGAWQAEAPTHYWIDASNTSVYRVPGA